MSLRTLCALALLVCAPLPATAQEAPAQEATGKEAPIDVLTDLAETLGQAHAIRSLCNGDDDQTWRNYMFTMLNMEGPSGSPRRSAMTSAFNRGFRTQQGNTKSCTPDMPKLEAQIAARGRVLAETAANSYLH
ncbi:MAG: TIGR02301 family protein [Hyphomonadaceae bacterium]|nr:TIGR02301 family protein [Hyphomonadaceae bacterium]